jgi:predicted amidophosphoribosyltransferase
MKFQWVKQLATNQFQRSIRLTIQSLTGKDEWMFCQQCGARQPDQANFCAKCGARMINASTVADAKLKSPTDGDQALPNESKQNAAGGTRRCPYCAELVQTQAIMCRYCGKSLAPNSPLPTEGSATPDFSHLPEYYREEFEKIHSSGEKYKGKFNGWAFLISPLWALSKGLWLSALICCAAVILGGGLAPLSIGAYADLEATICTIVKK